MRAGRPGNLVSSFLSPLPPLPKNNKPLTTSRNIIAELAESTVASATAGTATTNPADDAPASATAASSDAHAEAERVKDQIDDAVAKGPKKADENSGGRVQVAETGDLHDLAARRRSSA